MQALIRTKAKIHALLDGFNLAFKEHNSTGLLSLFIDEDNITFIGSESIEIAFNREQLSALLQRLFARPVTYTWEWQQREISVVGNVAWAMVEAIIHANYDNGEHDSGPYRISGVFKREGREWKWVHFHGSEPMAIDE